MGDLPLLSIDPDGIYTEGALVLALDIPSCAIDRARRTGHLAWCRCGRRILFRGQWLLDWLEHSKTGSEPEKSSMTEV